MRETITEQKKNEIKGNLSIYQVLDYVNNLGGEGQIVNDNLIIFKTICHGGDSRKLYYYNNSHLFKCYTHCEETSGFDIYELTIKVFALQNKDISLVAAIGKVANFFGLDTYENFPGEKEFNRLCDWDYFNKRKEEEEKTPLAFCSLSSYDDKILQFLPHPRIIDWEEEGISNQTLKNHNICYNPISNGIVIPHYDIDDNLIGIRERTLEPYVAEHYGKYMPARIGGQMFNHPLSFNLYNLNHSKNNIKTFSKAIVFEGEKSCLKYSTIFGDDNDISVACCGSSIFIHQINLLLEAGAKEIIIAFDKQFKNSKEEEFFSWVKKLENIHKKYGHLVTISFLFDKWNLLDYKDSPIDKGEEIFSQLFKDRIFLS